MRDTGAPELEACRIGGTGSTRAGVREEDAGGSVSVTDGGPRVDFSSLTWTWTCMDGSDIAVYCVSAIIESGDDALGDDGTSGCPRMRPVEGGLWMDPTSIRMPVYGWDTCVVFVAEGAIVKNSELVTEGRGLFGCVVTDGRGLFAYVATEGRGLIIYGVSEGRGLFA